MLALDSGFWEPALKTRDALVVLCTCPDAGVADRIAHALVDERLAACVNRVPGVVSTYRWQDQVTTDEEVLLVIKTTRAAYAALETRLVELHPYEVPEVIALDLAAGHAAYLAWIAAQTRAP